MEERRERSSRGCDTLAAFQFTLAQMAGDSSSSRSECKAVPMEERQELCSVDTGTQNSLRMKTCGLTHCHMLQSGTQRPPCLSWIVSFQSVWSNVKTSVSDGLSHSSSYRQ